jgi:2-dehydropantoate 2-reductase
MRILIIGAGATGGYFGARLALAGRDVTFLVRATRAAALRADGLTVVGLDRTDTINPPILTADQLESPFDLIVIAVKAGDLTSALVGIEKAVGDRTVIVPFLNGVTHLDELTARFPGQVLGGIVRVVTAVDDAGRIVQFKPLSSLTIGELSTEHTSRLAEAYSAFNVPGIDASIADDITASMWHKWAFIAASGVATCLFRNTIGNILAVPGGEEAVRRIISECEAVSAAAGYPVTASEHQATVSMLTESGSVFTSSLYRDVTAGLPGEIEHLIGQFAARARDGGVATPILDLALIQLRAGTAAPQPPEPPR